MILDKVLLIKGLGGLTACAGLACTGTYIANPDLFKTNDQILANLISKVGLKTCTTTSPECSIENSGLNLKQGEDKVEKKTKSTPSTSSGNGKIKVYKDNSTTGYNKGFKFVIEDGDITLADNKKLEQFETYEIKEDETDKKWYLTRKNKDIEEKKKFLGLPDNCTLVTTETTDSCTLTEEQVKAINFKDKGAGKDVSVTSGATTKLTIVKSSDTEFPEGGYKFIFKTTGDITIPKTEENQQITIKANTNTEFKIKKEANKWTLEKAWTVTTLGAKVGLTCPADESTNECTLPTNNTLKLYNDSGDKLTNGKVSDNTKKLKYEENVAGHNQGFKFFAEQDIELNGDNSGKKIEKKGDNGPTYEIKKVESEWYLAKKI